MITWREQLVCSLLLLVARIFVDDDDLSKEIKNISIAIRAKSPGIVL